MRTQVVRGSFPNAGRRIASAPWQAGPDAAPTALAKPAVNALALLGFAAGATCFWKINLFGELYIGELLLVFVGLCAAMAGGRQRPFKSSMFILLLACSLLSLSGYIISDLYRGSEPEQFLRGWARSVFVLSSFVSLTLLFSVDRRNIWWFLFGVGLGAVLYFKLVNGFSIRDPYAWKNAYSHPLSLLLLATSPFIPRRLLAVGMVALGVFSVSMDFRIHGLLCMLVGILVWMAGTDGTAKLDIKKLALIGLAGAVALALGTAMVNYYSSEWHEARRLQSDVGREAGLRFGLAAIASSPILGYGSWSNDRELLRIGAQAYAATLESLGLPADRGEKLAVTNAHSHVLQAWVEGGVLGAIFFMVLAFQLVRWILRAAAGGQRDYLGPVILYIFIIQLWNVFMSPLGSSSRFQVATVMAVMVVLAAASAGDSKRIRGQRRVHRGAVRQSSR
jgi:O-antigen ligase